ncbi:MAG TPA: pseudouridine synthase [Thermomicrobiales bacterium]|nr:pseudouridine synthase [Thermomicrobiales bacterium]
MSKRAPSSRHERDDAPAGERLQRVLAARGVASRRSSEQLIVDGRVQVNGATVTELGTRVDPLNDEIRVDGKVLRRQRPRFILLNKPSGFITTVSDERKRWTVMDLVDVPERVYPVGRLDRETQGLLLLTNEGTVANRVMHPKYGLAKEYHVITNKRPTDRQLQRVRDGIEVAGRMVVPDECRLLRESPEGIIVKVVLHEGLYHVVRQIMETVGIEVVRLRRVRVGPLTIQGIPSGAWRDLTPGELSQLYEALGLPAEDAERVNMRRPQQLSPTGGFHHPGSSGPQRGPAGQRGGGQAPRPPAEHGGHDRDRRPSERKPSGERPGPGRPARGPHQPNDRQRTSPGRGNDGTRPSPGHRNRRPGRGR